MVDGADSRVYDLYMEIDIDHLREQHADYPDDIVSRLLNEAELMGHDTTPGGTIATKALHQEAAQTIDNLRNGRGG